MRVPIGYELTRADGSTVVMDTPGVHHGLVVVPFAQLRRADVAALLALPHPYVVEPTARAS